MGFKRRKSDGARAVLAGKDPDAFLRFYELHAERLLVFLTRRVLDVDTAMDLTAETFATALELRAQFRGTTAEESRAGCTPSPAPSCRASGARARSSVRQCVACTSSPPR